MERLFVRCFGIFLGLLLACEPGSEHKAPSQKVPEGMVDMDSFLAGPPGGLYLLKDFRDQKPLMYLVFDMPQPGVIQASVRGFPSGSPYAAKSKCAFCPQDHPGHGKPLDRMVLVQELRPGRRGWIGGTFLDPAQGYTFLADLEPAPAGDLVLVCRIGAQRRAHWLQRVVDVP